MRISSPGKALVVLLAASALLAAAVPGMAGDLSGTATLMAYAHETQVTLNGVVLTPLSGGASQSIRLFNPEHPMRSQAPDNMTHMFSLKEGENVIEVTFEKSSGDDGDHDLELDLRIEVAGFDKPHFHMTVKHADQGAAKRTFVVGAPGSELETTTVGDEDLDSSR